MRPQILFTVGAKKAHDLYSRLTIDNHGALLTFPVPPSPTSTSLNVGVSVAILDKLKEVFVVDFLAGFVSGIS